MSILIVDLHYQNLIWTVPNRIVQSFLNVREITQSMALPITGVTVRRVVWFLGNLTFITQMSHQDNDNTTVHFSLFIDQYSTEEL